LVPIEGSPPDLFAPPVGCPFAARCEYAMEICIDQMPDAEKSSATHSARCWLNDSKAPSVKDFVAAGGER
ncbi:MAG: oligopeptide/dipeptide ABC transporter ATP-binding protein, partial [Anaerobacillus sp.]